MPPALYSGPGDIVSGAISWFGLRAYSFATVGSNAIRLRRASDNAESNFVTTFPTGIIDIPSITTFLTSTSGFVSKWYDQSGNGNDLVQATAASQPSFPLSVIGTFPVVRCGTGKQMEKTSFSGSGRAAPANPWTFNQFFLYRSSSGSCIQTTYDGSDDPGYFVDNAGNGGWYTGGTTDLQAVATGSWHATTGLAVGAAPNNKHYVENNVTTTATPGLAQLRATLGLNDQGFGDTGGTDFDITECGIWASAWSAANVSAVISNQHGYWGA
jgi:hypothetical protein